MLTKRAGHLQTGAIGTFCVVSGLLALVAHWLLEPAMALDLRDLMLITLLGLGPLGGSFYLWHVALHNADARRVGLIAFATPAVVNRGLVDSKPRTTARLDCSGDWHGGVCRLVGIAQRRLTHRPNTQCGTYR